MSKDELDALRARQEAAKQSPRYDGTWRPEEQDMLRFKDYLNERGLICTIRESKGIDISAACGQLKEKDANGDS